MIKLCSTPTDEFPDLAITPGMMDHCLHGKVVQELEERFAEYTGYPYAVAVHSATMGLQMVFEYFVHSGGIDLPYIIPKCVENAALSARIPHSNVDNTDWVGGPVSYLKTADMEIVDSAHSAEPYQSDSKNSVVVYSFYPTKPIGGLDGGMVVTDDINLAEWVRASAYNGTVGSRVESWVRREDGGVNGHKAYMSTFQAMIVQKLFEQYPAKKERLLQIQEIYNRALGLDNTSLHLYRIKIGPDYIDDGPNMRDKFIDHMFARGITCGVHYAARECPTNTKSHIEALRTVSIPFHCKLTPGEVEKVLEGIDEWLKR